MNICSKCLLNEAISRVAITSDGECNFCINHIPWKGHDEALLLNLFSKAKKKGRVYDALVPLSGGKRQYLGSAEEGFFCSSECF